MFKMSQFYFTYFISSIANSMKQKTNQPEQYLTHSFKRINNKSQGFQAIFGILIYSSYKQIMSLQALGSKLKFSTLENLN